MAANTGKDQPPACTSQDDNALKAADSAGPSTTPNFKPCHSKRALELLQATSDGLSIMSQYLELTFSIMVKFHYIFNPVVLTIDEDYDALFKDFYNIFVVPRIKVLKKGTEGGRMTGMEVFWKPPFETYGWRSTDMTADNITAMLRLLKSRNGKDHIVLS